MSLDYSFAWEIRNRGCSRTSIWRSIARWPQRLSCALRAAIKIFSELFLRGGTRHALGMWPIHADDMRRRKREREQERVRVPAACFMHYTPYLPRDAGGQMRKWTQPLLPSTAAGGREDARTLASTAFLSRSRRNEKESMNDRELFRKSRNDERLTFVRSQISKYIFNRILL